MTDLTDPMFHDDAAARAHFESLLWPNGPICPHCGVTEGLTRMEGKSHRPGLFQCNACRGHFTIMNGSIMERSHVPLHKWALAFHLMASSKKGMSAHQLHRMLKVNYRTAWFMEHRIRACMDNTKDTTPMGGEGTIVEIDETFIGKKEGMPVQRGYAHKHAIMTLVERGGSARSFHVDGTSAADLLPIIKRGMKGIYQHCWEKHLHRYVAEFDFRYSNRVRLGVDDTERTHRAIRGAKGKRLMYQ